MNNFYYQQKKQQGVVLISCIVFLLLILGLLKISLSSSKISEQKAGIDADLDFARQNAQLAIRHAEKTILSVIDKKDLSNCKTSKKSEKCLKDYRKAIEMVYIKATKNDNDKMPESFDSFSQEDKDIINSKALSLKQKEGIYHSPACKDKPVWKCASWGDAFPKYSGSLKTIPVNSIGSGNITAQDNKIDIAPRYLIEWFLPSELGMDANKGSVVFRITGIGFGQAPDADKTNVTNAVFQANYVL